jgi:glycosyltransferase involved in cell wall biosynthesis
VSNTEQSEYRLTSLSIFFPCFNEIDVLEDSAKRALATAARVTDDFEVIIVDDGSTDGTSKLADDLVAKNEALNVIHHENNKGYGAALQSGFKAATKDFIFYTDGDGQFDITDLPKIVSHIEHSDIVSCFRIDRKEGVLRRINAWCWGKLVCVLFQMRIKDIDCAFKLYKREIFDNIEMQSTGALIDAEILARSLRKGYIITQTGVHHHRRLYGASTGANLSVILRAFKELLRLRKNIIN